jgi:hypothetical protein
MENRIVKIVRLNLSNWIVFSRDQPGMVYGEHELEEILSRYLTPGECVGVMHEALKLLYGHAIELKASL